MASLKQGFIVAVDTTNVMEMLQKIGAPPYLSGLVGIFGPLAAWAITSMAKRRIWIFRPVINVQEISATIRSGEDSISDLRSLTEIDFDQSLRLQSNDIVTNIFLPHIYKSYLNKVEAIPGRNDRLELTLDIMKQRVLEDLHIEVRNASTVIALSSDGRLRYDAGVSAMVISTLRSVFRQSFKYTDELDEHHVFDVDTSDHKVFKSSVDDAIKNLIETVLASHMRFTEKAALIRSEIDKELKIYK